MWAWHGGKFLPTLQLDKLIPEAVRARQEL